MTAAKQSRVTHIGPSGRAALHLLVCCPRMPTDVVAVMLRMRHARSAAQLLARLRGVGLAQYQIARLGPLLGSKPLRLWTLTPAGRAVLDGRGLALALMDDARLPYGNPERWPETARQRDLPMLVAAYRLLAEVVGNLPGRVRMVAWEHPWVRMLRPGEGGRGRHVRLPAAVVLIDACGLALRLVLVPDLGTAPLSSYRAALRGLIELRQAADVDDDDEPLLLVGVATYRDSSARADAWRSLLQQVARKAGDRPLQARVLARKTGRTGANGRGQAEEVFALVARHPLLTRGQLASLVGTSVARIARLVTELVERGWVRPIQMDNQPHATVGSMQNATQRLGLVELTPAGRQEAARRLLVTAGLARRRHGFISADAARRRFLRHTHHTLGANAFFIDLAAAAMPVTSRGGDDELVEWRSAAACARGRFRPDGYGCYRRGPWRFGFFLEYDRGTERPGDYAAKLAAYYRYRDSGNAARDYDGFPTLLLVTTSDVAETRFAHQVYLAHQQHGSAPLCVLLTTSRRIEAHAEGVLGPVWRVPSTIGTGLAQLRGYWLPGRPGRRPCADSKPQ
jgi:Replication-relaxation